MLSENEPKQLLRPTVEEIDAECEIHGPFKATMATLTTGEKIIGKCKQCKPAPVETKEPEKKRIGGSYGIPLRFRDKGFDNFKALTQREEKVLVSCIGYAANFSENLALGRSAMFCGHAGTGKTHIACAIANDIAKRGYSSIFSSVYGAVRSVKDTYARDSVRSERQAIEEYVKPDLLILDEVGMQFGSDTEKNILFEIINARYENMRPTILISNLSLDDVRKFVGDRIVDRMRENNGLIVLFDWESRR